MTGWLLSTKLGRGAIAVFSFVVFIVSFGLIQRGTGKKLNEAENIKEAMEDAEGGRKAVQREREETDGLSKRDLVDRMRRRDAD